jgi:hypothetical protein
MSPDCGLGLVPAVGVECRGGDGVEGGLGVDGQADQAGVALLPLYLKPQAEHPAGLVPRHDAPHRADPARQGPARTPTGGVRRQRRRPAGTAQVVLLARQRLRALQTVEDLEFDVDVAGPEQRKLCKAVGEFGGYLRAAASIPNYGERYRAGEVISSSLAESTINQVVSKRMVTTPAWRARVSKLMRARSTTAAASASARPRRNSKCVGRHEARTYSFKSAPVCSTTTSPTSSAAGTPASPTPSKARQPGWPLPRNLPRFAPLSYSRDGKKGLPQIEYGLLTDPAGRPVPVRVFAGNTADPPRSAPSWRWCATGSGWPGWCWSATGG